MAHPHTKELLARESAVELRAALRTVADEAQKTRIRAIISIREGRTHSEVARTLAVSRTSLISWIGAYNGGGIEALKLSKGGRPEGNPVWDTEIFDALAKEIDTGGRYWSVPLMQEWIKEKHQQDIPGNTVWYHMRNLKYSFKSARPHPYQGNTEAQDAFKKGALRRYSRGSVRNARPK